MIVKQYVKDFENLGFGLFVHFGLYSVIGKGEWSLHLRGYSVDEYVKETSSFSPHKDWADELAFFAKRAGCKYITLTTRHHDGFSLYDTCGLNEFDAKHLLGRDLIREFVDACHKYGLKPFFYHTLLDWTAECYKNDFPAYLDYLRNSIDILCNNYGKIGGFWFDGMWDKPNDDWQEDELYGVIRKYQPEAMIINNTGMENMGAVGHIEIDSVTFERGKPSPINQEGAPKYIASEMCEIFGDHWGYAKKDFNYKSVKEIIETLSDCRKYRSNFLLNVGPAADGTLKTIDKGMLELIGDWVNLNEKALRTAVPTNIEIKDKPNDFVLQDGDTYFLFVHGLGMSGDPNVTKIRDVSLSEKFEFGGKIKSVCWLDSNETVDFTQDGKNVTIFPTNFRYGESYVVRILEIKA